ncbi:MAG: Lrp/AsnC family transcriptional regulator [Nitrospirae bacterium]|nr:Lrp/AsnC family transcriptional regulator [Nitrospirota bacterium]
MEKEIIQILEDGIPIVSEPFKEMAHNLGISVDLLLEEIKRLKEHRIIRQISPIYDSKMMGFETSLVTFKISMDRLENAVAIINSYPGVSHNYERDADFNLWFTIAVPPDSPLNVQKIVEIIAAMAKPDDYIHLYPKRLFKIGVKLSAAAGVNDKEEVKISQKVFKPLTDVEKALVRVTQVDIPLIYKPFEHFASVLEIDEKDVLSGLRDFMQRGIFRRFAAVLYHRQMGYVANAMVVWKVPDEAVEHTAQSIASFKAVSHCYERTSSYAWPYNLYSMIHGKSKKEVEDIIDIMKKEIDVNEYKVIYSTREFKKARPKYFTEDYYTWFNSLSILPPYR